jgi:drug/metabolite transporter (DMT)-like permease
MRLLLLTALVMVAFAANSVLNRLALADGQIGPLVFAFYRVGSGAAVLALLVLVRDRRFSLAGPYRAAGVLSLTLYMVAFSTAYVALDAGVGALILFGGVQVTMFAGAVLAREPVPALRWAGAGLAFAGLVWLLWPDGAVRVPVLHALIMVAAALGWGIYSLAGRKSGEPLRATAANFVLAVPICWLVLALAPVSPDAVPPTARGIGLAVVSGVVTSALGYALWYTVLPKLQASVAAVAQLTVPVIAMAGGMVVLGEVLTPGFLVASALVLGGVGLSVLAARR